MSGRIFPKDHMALVLPSSGNYKNECKTATANQGFIVFPLFFHFSEQTRRARWPPRPWAHPHPTGECIRPCSARRPWGPPAPFTLPSAPWVRPWTAWPHPSPSSARPWAPTPWTRPVWATAPASAPRWGPWQTHTQLNALCVQGSRHMTTINDLFVQFCWHALWEFNLCVNTVPECCTAASIVTMWECEPCTVPFKRIVYFGKLACQLSCQKMSYHSHACPLNTKL